MSRLAGPPSAQTINRQWRKRVEERRIDRSRFGGLPPAPLVSPPAKRRRQAFLWFMHHRSADELIVGMRGWPPYTPDMRWLVGQGFLTLGRVASRVNMLRLTDKGRKAVLSQSVPLGDRLWVYSAAIHGMLR